MNNWVLVTGAYGFLGRNVAKLFQKKGYRIYGIGHGEWIGESPRKYGIEIWEKSDVTLAALKKIRKFFYLIIHCAGSSSIDLSMQNPVEDFQKTVITTLSMLEYMRLFQKNAALILPSSVAVYGDKGSKKIKENDSLEPVSCYGYHKKISEELCGYYAKNYLLKITIIRFFSLYGPELKKQLIWEACNRLLANKGKAVFYGNGDELRDWLYIDDAVKLIFKIYKIVRDFEIYNGASGKSYSVKEVLELIASEYGYQGKIEFNNRARPGQPEKYRADVSKVLKLNWEPTIDIISGIKNYVRWFKKQKYC